MYSTNAAALAKVFPCTAQDCTVQFLCSIYTAFIPGKPLCKDSLVQGGLLCIFESILFNTASSAAPQILLCRRMLGLDYYDLALAVRCSSHSNRSHPLTELYPAK
jgi:hypothetical protein